MPSKPAVAGTLPAPPHDISRVAPKRPPAGRSPPQIGSTLPGADLRKAVSAFLVAVVWRLLPCRSFFKYRRAMRRNSGYTRSASRPRAVSSPLLQTFHKAVISADDP